MYLRGNLHTHTNQSDGDGSPEQVIQWYANHQYDFLVLTDHNKRTMVDSNPSNMILLPGEEITIHQDDKELHMNAVHIHQSFEPTKKDSVQETLAYHVETVTKAGGILTINHPNFIWSLGIKELEHLPDSYLLEIYNAHPSVNTRGLGSAYPSDEAIWDALLSKGKRIYGVAVDDMHTLTGEWGFLYGNPGYGWVMVEVEERTEKAIAQSLRKGSFYASSGVMLEHLSMHPDVCEIRVHPRPTIKYLIQWIGQEGELLSESYAQKDQFYPKAVDSSYIRVRVTDSAQRFAWSQPLFLS